MLLRWRRTSILLLAAICSAPGCVPPPKSPPPPQKTPSLALDPCADQLHDIAGLLLEYYVDNRKLPPTIDDLKAMDPARPALFICPTSHKPYIYDPAGMIIPGSSAEIGRVVLYDATPVHRGLRWGIAIQQRGAGQQIVTRIIALPPAADLPATRPAAP